MDTSKAAKLLNESITSLNLNEKELYEGEKCSIVEFCLNTLQLDEQSTIDFCQEYLPDFPAFKVKYVVLQEAGVWDGIRQRIGARANPQSMFSKYGNRPTDVAGTNTMNIGAKLGNMFGTQGSVFRNSPMMKVSSNGKASYFAFPNLDLNQKGHMEILQNIIAKENGNGKVASMVDQNSGDREAALKAGKVTQIGTQTAGMDKKGDMNKALADLSALITQQKQSMAATNTLISPQQLSQFKTDVNDKLSHIDTIEAQQNNPAETAKAATDAEAQIDKTVANPAAGMPDTGAPVAPGVAATPTPTPTEPAPSFADQYKTALQPAETPAIPGTTAEVNPPEVPPVNWAPDINSEDLAASANQIRHPGGAALNAPNFPALPAPPTANVPRPAWNVEPHRETIPGVENVPTSGITGAPLAGDINRFAPEEAKTDDLTKLPGYANTPPAANTFQFQPANNTIKRPR